MRNLNFYRDRLPVKIVGHKKYYPIAFESTKKEALDHVKAMKEARPDYLYILRMFPSNVYTEGYEPGPGGRGAWPKYVIYSAKR